MEQVEPQSKQDTQLKEIDFAGVTLMLPDEQKAELDSRLNELHHSLTSASSKLNELHEPSAEINNSDMYKQPESNLLSYVRVLTASATSNVLDVLESLPLVLDKAKSENAQLLKSIAQNSDSANTGDGLSKQVTDHLQTQNNVLDALSEAHSHILNLHSFQDLTSQAVIRAEAMTQEAKSAIADAQGTLHEISGLDEHLAKASVATDNPDAVTSNSQLDQSDVDSLFSSMND